MCPFAPSTRNCALGVIMHSAVYVQYVLMRRGSTQYYYFLLKMSFGYLQAEILGEAVTIRASTESNARCDQSCLRGLLPHSLGNCATRHVAVACSGCAADGWVFEDRLVTHTPTSGKVVDGRHLSGRRA